MMLQHYRTYDRPKALGRGLSFRSGFMIRCFTISFVDPQRLAQRALGRAARHRRHGMRPRPPDHPGPERQPNSAHRQRRTRVVPGGSTAELVRERPPGDRLGRVPVYGASSETGPGPEYASRRRPTTRYDSRNQVEESKLASDSDPDSRKVVGIRFRCQKRSLSDVISDSKKGPYLIPTQNMAKSDVGSDSKKSWSVSDSKSRNGQYPILTPISKNARYPIPIPKRKNISLMSIPYSISDYDFAKKWPSSDFDSRSALVLTPPNSREHRLPEPGGERASHHPDDGRQPRRTHLAQRQRQRDRVFDAVSAPLRLAGEPRRLRQPTDRGARSAGRRFRGEVGRSEPGPQPGLPLGAVLVR